MKNRCTNAKILADRDKLKQLIFGIYASLRIKKKEINFTYTDKYKMLALAENQHGTDKMHIPNKDNLKNKLEKVVENNVLNEALDQTQASL